MISVICPVWNKSDLTHRFILEHWQLYRLSPDVELVIINNGSTDNTDLILRQWVDRWDAIRVISNADNAGFGPANNQGAQFAKGDTLVFLSNDVLIEGDYISLVSGLSLNKVICGPQVLDYDTGWNKFNGKVIPYVAGWCIAMNRATFDDLGGWDERYIPCDYEDLDLAYTAIQRGYQLKQVRLPLTHLFGQSAQAISGGREAITLRNRELFKQKWGLS